MKSDLEIEILFRRLRLYDRLERGQKGWSAGSRG
jgi:hypothetical protein